MAKRDTQLFAGSFFGTLLLLAFLWLFLLTDWKNAYYDNINALPALSIEHSQALDYQSTLLGKQYPLSLESINEAEQLRKEYAVLTTPRPVILLEQAEALVWYYATIFYEQYKEYEYQLYVQNQEANS